MIEIRVKNGESSFSGAGKGVELIEDCLTIVRTLSKHLATESEDLAGLYEYLLTKQIKAGTFFDDGAKEAVKDIFIGKLNSFLKGEE